MVHRKERLDVEVIRARGLVGKPGNKQTPGMSNHDTICIFFSLNFFKYVLFWTILWGLYVNSCGLPIAAPYVKVYLLDNGKCINKKKTRTARKTLDPLYQQQLQFEENPEGKVLQVTSGLHPVCFLWYVIFYFSILDNITAPHLLKLFDQSCLSLQIIVWGDYGRMDHKSFMGAAQILLDDLELTNMVIGWYKLFPPTSLVDPTLAPLSSKPPDSGLDSSNVRS